MSLHRTRLQALHGLLPCSWLVISLMILFSAAAVPGSAQAQPAAGGFQAVAHGATSGTVLLRRFAIAAGAAKPSARQLAQQGLQALASGLDRAPRLLSGMVSRDDDEAMMSFAGHWRGTLVQGTLVATVAAHAAVVAVAIDEPKQLARTGPELLAAAQAAAFPGQGGERGVSPYRNLSWSTVSFGSGQVSLPQGWRVVGAHQGAVDIVGPQGEVASLGAANQVTTPQTAQYWAARGLPPQTYVAAATDNPVDAFRSVQPQMERFTASRGGPVVRLTQVREAERIPSFGSPGTFNAALVASDGIGSIGNRPYRKLSLVAAGGVMANGNWLYYNSEVYAPTELYPYALPVLLKIWNSWSVDKTVLMERMVSAAKSLRETNEILRSAQANREAVPARASGQRRGAGAQPAHEHGGAGCECGGGV
jgi:hypothetical protein